MHPDSIVNPGDVVLLCVSFSGNTSTHATVVRGGQGSATVQYRDRTATHTKDVTWSATLWPHTWTNVVSRKPQALTKNLKPAAVPKVPTVQDLIALAKTLALDIVKLRGKVTSTDVFTEMRAQGVLMIHDPRWMGKVFTTREGWKRLRYARVGSHRRPISVWGRK